MSWRELARVRTGLTVREQVRPGRLSEVKEYDMSPPLSTYKPMADEWQNRQNSRRNYPVAKGRRARILQLGHFPPPQARKETAVHPPIWSPLHHALRRQCARTAHPATDNEFGPAVDPILGCEDGREV
jgi:hypothetical protein